MLVYYDHAVHMSHWEGFGTLLMATDTSNALLDPVLYNMGRTQCESIGMTSLSIRNKSYMSLYDIPTITVLAHDPTAFG